MCKIFGGGGRRQGCKSHVQSPWGHGELEVVRKQVEPERGEMQEPGDVRQGGLL